MKKFSLLLGVLFINILLTAQIYTISDSISWQNSKIYIDNDNNQWNILSFVGAYNRSSDDLPIYHDKKRISNSLYVYDIELVKTNYEVINKALLSNVKNIENLSNEIVVNANIIS